MLYIEDVTALSEIVNNSEMEFDEIVETFPEEVLEEYAESLEITPITISEKEFLEHYEDFVQEKEEYVY